MIYLSIWEGCFRFFSLHIFKVDIFMALFFFPLFKAGTFVGFFLMPGFTEVVFLLTCVFFVVFLMFTFLVLFSLSNFFHVPLCIHLPLFLHLDIVVLYFRLCLQDLSLVLLVYSYTCLPFPHEKDLLIYAITRKKNWSTKIHHI